MFAPFSSYFFFSFFGIHAATQVTLSAPTALYMFRTLAAGADPQSFGPPSSSGHHPQAHRGSNIVSSGMEHSSSIGESAAWRGTRISSLDSVGSLGDSSIGSLDDLTFDASQEVCVRERGCFNENQKYLFQCAFFLPTLVPHISSLPHSFLTSPTYSHLRFITWLSHLRLP